MDRVFLCALVFFVIFLSVLNVVQPSPIRAWGYGIFREYQCFLLNAQTSNWPTLMGEHFIVKYQSGDEASAQIVLQEAERVYYLLGDFLGCFPDKKVPILIHPDRVSLNRVFGWGSEQSAMGVYWAGAIRVLSPRDWLGDLAGAEQRLAFAAQGPVAHEYLHLLVDYKSRGNCPRWLTEGIAQYGEEFIAGVDTPKRRYGLMWLPLQELEVKFDDPAWQDYCYAQARDMVAYLVQTFGMNRLALLLDALGRASSLDKAFSGALGISLDEFLRQHARTQGAE